MLAGIRPDVVFNALHGTPGEDGTVQGMLDLMQIPYTHSGLETSVIAIDKELTKMVLVPHGIRMPTGEVVESESLHAARPDGAALCAEAGQRGLVGRRRDRHRRQQLRQSRSAATSRDRGMHFDRLLAEPFVKGHELTVAVLNGEALCVTELKPKVGFYDYDSKYTDGLTEHVCPAEVPDNIAAAMMDMAASAHRLLGCKGASRSDFRWDDEQGEAGIYLLEVNTQPGMTPLSLVPEQAQLARHQLWRAGRAADR